VDFQDEALEEKLSYYQEFKKMKGFRHILQGEKQRDFMLRPDFKRGIGKLKHFGYTYDILIFPDQLNHTLEFVRAFPDQPFVLDHLAKPYIKDKKIDAWKLDLKRLASCENVFCKISGMVTEANWKNWAKEDFYPYLEAAVEAFGTSRLMYGSDWPVCLVAASYRQVFNLVQEFFSRFSPDEQDLIFGKNAMRFYNL
jgi:L-fuconolactonase